MNEYYEFLDYISNEQLEQTFQLDKDAMIDEIRGQFGNQYNITDEFLRRYWADRILAEWRRTWCLEWLYDRSRRPIYVEDIDIKTILSCCHIHLEACYFNSFENCDLVERNHFRSKYRNTNCACPQCYNQQLDERSK